MSNKKRKTTEVEFEYTETEVDVPKDVTIVRFHSSITEVCSCVFGECKQLHKVVLNEGLRKIVGGVFYGCASLKSITLPSTVSEISMMNAFGRCTSLEKVELNEGLQTIGKYAFSSCTSLESITIPPTVTEISKGTFYNCQRLREVELHEGIQMIVSDAFYGCSSLERFKFPNLSSRLNSIVKAGKYVDVENKIDNIRGTIVQRRGSEVFIPYATLSPWRDDIWKVVREALGRIDRTITYYELKEATTLLELAIWKAKIDQAEVKPSMNRDEYRIDIPGPVKNNILQFLNFRV